MPVIDFPEFTWTEPTDRHANRVVSEKPIQCPFTVIIDTREQAPFTFRGMRCDSRQKYRPLVVPTETYTLHTGDYSVYGLHDSIAIERKSLSDLFSTVTMDRERFIRELERLNRMVYSAVVIEGDWDQVKAGPQRIDKTKLHSETVGNSVYESIVAWDVRYPKIKWWAMPSRQFAEHHTFRLLRRFWVDEQERLKQQALKT